MEATTAHLIDTYETAARRFYAAETVADGNGPAAELEVAYEMLLAAEENGSEVLTHYIDNVSARTEAIRVEVVG